MPSNRWAVLVACVTLASACRSTNGETSSVPVSPPASAAVSAPGSLRVPVGGGVAAAAGTGWDISGLEGPVPGPGACTYRVAADGFYLPDPSCTPGSADPGVTQSDLESTICRRGGYTASVRPPESMTEPFKRESEAAYQDPNSSYHSELDHLVPLELGGASDTLNLWAEPDQGRPAQFDPQDPYGINAKDGVEDRLHSAVCAGQVRLAAAQQAIAADWTTALARLGVAP